MFFYDFFLQGNYLVNFFTIIFLTIKFVNCCKIKFFNNENAYFFTIIFFNNKNWIFFTILFFNNRNQNNFNNEIF